MSILDFFTPEAGQARRRALSRVDQKISDALGYYLGPQLAPRVEQAANIAGLLSPGQDVQDAYTASGELMAPNRSLLDRAASGAALAGAMGAMVMPGGVSSIRQGIDDLAEAGVRAYDPATTNAFTVWHGSPHDFDRFDMSKIGTGEGAQAYGHGLYFADGIEVAKSYLDAGRRASYGPDLARSMLRAMGGDYKRAARMIRAEIDQTGDLISREELQDLQDALYHLDRGQISGGHLYEVSIDAEPEDFLDWDAPFQSPDDLERFAARFDATDPMLRKRIEDFGYVRQQMGQPMPDGNDIIREVMGGIGSTDAAKATVTMREAGIPGIRYLDAGSRGAGDGSRNYVLFDDSLATIVGKDGQYTPAQQIARLLREGRGAEVTDELYAQADPQELSRLYDAGATGMDMPMGPAALERAREMGFDEPAFHGTGYGGFDAFSSDASRVGGATYADVDPNVANAYARYGDAGQVYPVQMRAANPERFDLLSWDPQREVGALDYAKSQGHDAYYATDGRRIAFDPANIRSRFARFDPRLSHLRNLSAGLAGAGALGLGLLSMPPSQAEAEQYLAERGLLQ